MAVEPITQRYCPICGRPVAEGVFDRFGEWCCSEGHAQEYVAEVRAQKQRQHAGAEPQRPRRQFRGG